MGNQISQYHHSGRPSQRLLAAPSQPQTAAGTACELDLRIFITDAFPVIARITLTMRAWRRIYWALDFDESRLQDYLSQLVQQALQDNLSALLANKSDNQSHFVSIHNFAPDANHTIELAVSISFPVVDQHPHYTFAISTRTECDIYQVDVID